VKDTRGNAALDCAAAIDLRSSASRVYDKSYDGIGGIQVLYSWGTKLFSAMTVLGQCFSAQGTTALSALHQGWREAGVRTPMDSTYESVLSALTAWKTEIIQRLLEKGAKSALEMEHNESRARVGRKRLERAQNSG
jgi:hypothetical protein